ncbi:putative Dolichyl-phosphate beta-glucosyltransferase [Danaus plexippus plexippus]|uniref:Dolichyl-phosphate beta-glucosyltransferase n=1 Tax=Danaus plexippus plexippus TaxID=278856 RepID=A0A212ERS4_DANPL|nr:putative Dolichyl-phosphate beta-glucosyltransferase [Danaus plexippus plexippus]
MEFLSILYSLIIYGLLAVVALLLILVLFIFITTSPYPIVERFKEEEYYYDPVSKQKNKFPSIETPYSVNLSVIVPAYNEEERLTPMLDEALEFLENRVKEHPSYKYEIIVVSDGSRDNTVKLVQSYVEKYGSDKLRCLDLMKNRGKGGAVRLGVQSARGAAILFADADGASKFEDLTKLELALKNITNLDPITQSPEITDKLAVIIGSRAHLEKDSLVQRSIFRNILMYGFHFLVWLFTVKGIKDTQCGFKLFTRKTAQMTFQSLHVNRWAFDVELLYIAQQLRIPVVEVPITWTEIDGSKITPVISWIQMGCDLAMIWIKYTIGAWKIKYETN